MNASLPSWPMERMIKEACFEFTLLHPLDPVDPETSPWIAVYNAVQSFVRHSQSLYDDEMDAGADRDQLRHEIRDAACRKYPWLRLGVDPRRTKEPEASAPPPRLFAARSKELSGLVTEKDRLIRERIQLKRVYHLDYKAKVAEINHKIAALDDLAAELFKSFKVAKGETKGKVPYNVSHQKERGYIFGGRQLHGNYIAALGFWCIKCGKTVFRTKRAIDHGCNIRLQAFSCECMSISVPDGIYAPDHEFWDELALGNRDRSESSSTIFVEL